MLPLHQMRYAHAISPQTDALLQALRNPKCTPELSHHQKKCKKKCTTKRSAKKKPMNMLSHQIVLLRYGILPTTCQCLHNVCTALSAGFATDQMTFAAASHDLCEAPACRRLSPYLLVPCHLGTMMHRR